MEIRFVMSGRVAKYVIWKDRGPPIYPPPAWYVLMLLYS